jgi:hypothetical protein
VSARFTAHALVGGIGEAVVLDAEQPGVAAPFFEVDTARTAAAELTADTPRSRRVVFMPTEFLTGTVSEEALA